MNIPKIPKLEKPMMEIRVGYTTFAVPYQEGLTILKALEQAEVIDKNSYGDESVKVTPISKDHISFSALPAKEYQIIKAAALMRLPYAKMVKAFEEENETE